MSVFHGPRSRANARMLVEAARALNIPTREVRTTFGGYLVPEPVLDLALGIEGIEEGVEYAPQQQEDPQRPNNGASRATWVEYASSVGIDVTDEMTRNDIRDLASEKE